MTRRQQLMAAAATATVVLGTGTGIAVATGGEEAGPAAQAPAACDPGTGTPQQIKSAKLYIEYNATDEDFGVHGSFAHAGWAELCVRDPSGVPFSSSTRSTPWAP